MHLIWENLVKNLFQFWTGTFKNLDHKAYQIPDDHWKHVGNESAALGHTIPLAFGPPPPNVATNKQSWTADSRSFWTLYLRPVLLDGRLHAPFFRHFIELVKLLLLRMLSERVLRLCTKSKAYDKWMENGLGGISDL
jgi:hypothetical protein